MHARLAIALVAAALVASGCRGGGDDDASPGVIAEESSTTSITAAPTTAAPSPETTVTTGPPAGAKPPTREGVPAKGVLVTGSKGATLHDGPDGETIGRFRQNITVAYDAIDGNWVRVLTPCENRAWIRLDRGTKLTSADVVVDAGHGGGEPGAVGPTGLTEKELNLDIAQRVVRMLDAQGLKAVLTRRTDYRVTLASRVAVAAALSPEAFISIHHNAEPDETRTGPGSETYYQVASADSKRLSGLLYEEIVAALAPFPAAWTGDRDAGAKVRLNLEGRDYYGILRRAFDAGVPATLIESAFVSNPTEEALLRRDDVRDAEAAAITRGLLRYLRGNDPGSGYVEAYVRHAPAGSGGGPAGCVEPS
jgi:N-acetylmuramoyl-L-alanine amidase